MAAHPVSLHKKKLNVRLNGALKEVPALHQNWCDNTRTFIKYMKYNAEDVFGGKQTWLQQCTSLKNDLKWLLCLEHHKFWSQMIWSVETQDMLTSFLQEAPPYYLLHQFPQDSEMINMLKKLEKLVFLVYVRISTDRETELNFISQDKIGNILYNNYIFTIPIILDICLLFGQNNYTLVSKMLQSIFEYQPKYLEDLKQAMPCMLKVFPLVTDKFQNKEIFNLNKINELTDLLIYLYDSVATIQIFTNVCTLSCEVFNENKLPVIISNFYVNVIPSMYNIIKKYSHQFDEIVKDLLDNTRVELLTTFRTLITFTLNSAVTEEDDKNVVIDKYLDTLTETLFNQLFLNDYNNVYSIECDIDILTQVCPSVDKLKLDFVVDGIKSYLQPPNEKSEVTNKDMSTDDVKLLIKQVKDVLPDVSTELIKECLVYYQNRVEDVLTAILENNLPPTAASKETKQVQDEVVCEEAQVKETKKSKHKTFNELYNDKEGFINLKNMYSKFSITDTFVYDDEYDDTYDEVDVTLRDDDDLERLRPFVTPRVLARKRDGVDESEESEEEKVAQVNKNHFVQNPEELRSKYERNRNNLRRGDVVGKPKGHGQEKNVTKNRDHKNVHKSLAGNHNRRNLAGRKRNQGMGPF